MAQNQYYDDPTNGVTLIDQIRLGDTRLPMSGKLGASGAGSTSIWIDDPEAVYDFLGQRSWYVEETDAPAQVNLTGTVSKFGTNEIIGVGTAFTAEVTVGREIVIPGGGGNDYAMVIAVCSDTQLLIDVETTHSASGQTAYLPSNQRVWTGYTGDQNIERGDSRPGGGELPGSAWPLAPAEFHGRDWQLDLIDLNTFLHFRIIQAGDSPDRPAETASDRLTWLLSVSFMSGVVYDEGLVFTSLTMMDAADYTGRYVDEVLNDLSQTTGWNHGLYYHEATGHYALFFASNDIAAYTSAFVISNVASDINPAAGVWPSQNAKLRRSAQKVIAGAYTTYSGGAVYRTNPATAATFAWRDTNASNSNIKNAATAADYADRYLDDNDEQDMLLTLTVTVPAANVNDVLPFQRVAVRLEHLPRLDCDNYTWCRVIQKTVSDHQGGGMPVPGMYDIYLELAPTFSPCAAPWPNPLPCTPPFPPPASVIPCDPSRVNAFFGTWTDLSVAPGAVTFVSPTALTLDGFYGGRPMAVFALTNPLPMPFRIVMDIEVTGGSTTGVYATVQAYAPPVNTTYAANYWAGFNPPPDWYTQASVEGTTSQFPQGPVVGGSLGDTVPMRLEWERMGWAPYARGRLTVINTGATTGWLTMTTTTLPATLENLLIVGSNADWSLGTVTMTVTGIQITTCNNP